jgi:eukaryotic-like serine/threonine-protein kinase
MPSVMRCGTCDLVTTGDIPVGSSSVSCPRCGKPLSAKPPDPLVGRTIGKCRLIRRIGMGAMAMVYEAERLSDQKRVAVKMLTGEASKDEENGRRFGREAELCMSINHPNVVAVSAHGRENKIYFMIMELVDGATMEAVIDQQGALGWRQVAHLILQIAQALDHLGRLGIIHRDIKPGNILLTNGGVAKLLDLGFAKRLGDGDSDDIKEQGELTMQGVSMGSPAYMPPEQVLDAKNADVTADVYSLGATFYHAVTGKTPFDGKTAYEVMEKVLKQPPTPPHVLVPQLPKAISQLIEWSMMKDPRQRPGTAADFIRELEVAIFAPEDSKRIKKLRRLQKGSNSTALVIGSVVLLAVIVLIAIVWKVTKTGG